MRRILSYSVTIIVGTCIGILVLEGTYRIQLLDTYGPELRSYNDPEQLSAAESDRTMLIMGDSFSVQSHSYGALLQKRLREWRVINSGVSGTGIIQALLMAPNRFSRFQPSIFIYQIYVGNDLFDIRYPINWVDVPVPRTLYWKVANHLRVLSFINYRLSQLLNPGQYRTPESKFELSAELEAQQTFSAEKYHPREKIHFKAEPSLLEDTILVEGSRAGDYARFLDGIERLVQYCQAPCRTYLLVIPHVAQVDPVFKTHLPELGARVTRPDILQSVDYPFLELLRERVNKLANVQVLNPLPVLRKALEQGPVYYANESHLNGRGQEVIEQFVLDELKIR